MTPSIFFEWVFINSVDLLRSNVRKSPDFQQNAAQGPRSVYTDLGLDLESNSGPKWPRLAGSGVRIRPEQTPFSILVFLNFVAFNHLRKRCKVKAKVKAKIQKVKCSYKFDCRSFWSNWDAISNLDCSYLKPIFLGWPFSFFDSWPLFSLFFVTVVREPRQSGFGILLRDPDPIGDNSARYRSCDQPWVRLRSDAIYPAHGSGLRSGSESWIHLSQTDPRMQPRGGKLLVYLKIIV